LLVLVLGACAPLLVLMLHTAGEDRRRAMNNWKQRSQTILRISHREEKNVIGATRQLLLAVSESSSVRNQNPARCQSWLKELFKSYPKYSNIGLLNTNGAVLASAQPPTDAEAPIYAGLARKVAESGSFSIGPGPPPAPKARPAISFGYPVLGITNEVLGVVFADLDLSFVVLSNSELPTQIPRNATWMEIDRSGIILSRFPKPEAWVGLSFPDAALVSAFFAGSNGVVQAGYQNGAAMFYAFNTSSSQLTTGPVAHVLGIPRHLLFAQADRELRRNLTWLGIAATLTLVLGWLGSQLLILRPVEALIDMSTRLAAGDLSVRTGLRHRPDELGRLTQAFDQMAHALEHREAERLRASQKLQVLSHRLVEVQESERRHIARELHDEIGQSLTAAEMNLQAALKSREANSVEQRLEQSIRAVERVLEQVHDLSLNLRPSMLDDLGLEPALRWYLHRQAELTGMKAEFHAQSIEQRFHPMVETECFRVAQEALTNVVRHARASCVRITLSLANGVLHLSVWDDGVGFDVKASREDAVRGTSLGLLSMEERATLAGGGLEFISSPGEGTEVHAWFPVSPQVPRTWRETDEQVK